MKGKKEIRRRVWGLFLALAMVLALVPAGQAQAAELTALTYSEDSVLMATVQPQAANTAFWAGGSGWRYSQYEGGLWVLASVDLNAPTGIFNATGTLTLANAGVSQVGAIEVDGALEIMGTGVLLADSITYTDGLSVSGVALFLKDATGSYVLQNDGRLDGECYTLPDGKHYVVPRGLTLTLVAGYTETSVEKEYDYYSTSLTVPENAQVTLKDSAAMVLQKVYDGPPMDKNYVSSLNILGALLMEGRATVSSQSVPNMDAMYKDDGKYYDHETGVGLVSLGSSAQLDCGPSGTLERISVGIQLKQNDFTLRMLGGELILYGDSSLASGGGGYKARSLAVLDGHFNLLLMDEGAETYHYQMDSITLENDSTLILRTRDNYEDTADITTPASLTVPGGISGTGSVSLLSGNTYLSGPGVNISGTLTVGGSALAVTTAGPAISAGKLTLAAARVYAKSGTGADIAADTWDVKESLIMADLSKDVTKGFTHTIVTGHDALSTTDTSYYYMGQNHTAAINNRTDPMRPTGYSMSSIDGPIFASAWPNLRGISTADGPIIKVTPHPIDSPLPYGDYYSNFNRMVLKTTPSGSWQPTYKELKEMLADGSKVDKVSFLVDPFEDPAHYTIAFFRIDFYMWDYISSYGYNVGSFTYDYYDGYVRKMEIANRYTTIPESEGLPDLMSKAWPLDSTKQKEGQNGLTKPLLEHAAAACYCMDKSRTTCTYSELSFMVGIDRRPAPIPEDYDATNGYSFDRMKTAFIDDELFDLTELTKNPPYIYYDFAKVDDYSKLAHFPLSYFELFGFDSAGNPCFWQVAAGQTLLLEAGETVSHIMAVYTKHSDDASAGGNETSASSTVSGSGVLGGTTGSASLCAVGVHSYVYSGGSQPSCSAPGNKAGICNCGATVLQRLAPLSHSYSGGACTVCGARDNSYVPPSKNPDSKPVVTTDTTTTTEPTDTPVVTPPIQVDGQTQVMADGQTAILTLPAEEESRILTQLQDVPAGSTVVLTIPEAQWPEGATAISMEISDTLLGAVVAAAGQVTVEHPLGAMTLDASTALQLSALGGAITLRMDTEAPLTAQQAAVIGDGFYVDLTATGPQGAVTAFDGAVTVAVSFPHAPDTHYTGYVLQLVSDDGAASEVLCDFSSGQAVFRRSSFSIYAIGYDPGHVWPDPFDDVRYDQWYYGAVRFGWQQGLLSGVSSNAFAPNQTLNRAMLATILWRMAGAPEGQDPAPFADVPGDAYYAQAVAWAYGQGIVEGVGADSFAPGLVVSRQQLATMLHRYSTAQGLDGAADSGLEVFLDGDAAADWARGSLSWAVERGVLKGYGDGTLAPTASCTRAEAAQMLLNYASVQ